jgi:hypothetical protein
LFPEKESVLKKFQQFVKSCAIIFSVAARRLTDRA